jgi:CBS domain-containing protein
MSILDLGSPPARFAWLSGSQGRKEQLLLTDQDSILILKDVAPDKYRGKRLLYKTREKTTAALEKIGLNFVQTDIWEQYALV